MGDESEEFGDVGVEEFIFQLLCLYRKTHPGERDTNDVATWVMGQIAPENSRWVLEGMMPRYLTWVMRRRLERENGEDDEVLIFPDRGDPVPAGHVPDAGSEHRPPRQTIARHGRSKRQRLVKPWMAMLNEQMSLDETRSVRIDLGELTSAEVRVVGNNRLRKAHFIHERGRLYFDLADWMDANGASQVKDCSAARLQQLYEDRRALAHGGEDAA
jgi:hypothetical protein